MHLWKRAVLSAVGVLLYVGAFAWLVNNSQAWVGPHPQGWVGAALVLIMFVVSACVTGSLVLMKPILLYVEGHKKEAVQLFAYTVVALAVIAVLIGGYMVMQGRLGDTDQPVVARCGGNMANAPVCDSGYHCAPEPGSHLPFGDVGGICIRN